MQPDLDNVKKRLDGSRDFVDKLLAKVPGFTGYFEKGAMYEADRIIRNFTAERLLTLKRDISAVMSETVQKGDKSALSDLDSLNTVLERIYKKVKNADYTTSASFSRAQITQDDNNRLLEYDWRLITGLDEVEAMVKKMKEAFTADQIKPVRLKVEDFEKSFDDRKNVILEVI